MPLTTLIHSHKKEKKLLSHMSDNFKSRVKSSPNTFSLQQFMSENLLQTIHYSWFPYYFKTLACEHKQALLINILSDQTVDKINSYFKSNYKKNNSNLTSNNFLIQLFSRKISKTILDDKLCDRSKNKILKLNKEQLINLINILSLYDLVFELRKIIKKTTITQVYALLSTDQKKFIHLFLQRKHKIYPASHVSLIEQSNNPYLFTKNLHQRGLLRLAIATKTYSAFDQWKLIHTLDIGRGKLLQKLYNNIHLDDKIQTCIETQTFNLVKKNFLDNIHKASNETV